MLNRKYRRRSQSLFLFPTDLGRSKRLCSQGSFHRKMSFHFRQVFPLICDRSVWHNVKHPCTCQSKRAVKVREATSTLLPYPILPPPRSFHPLQHRATLRYCHARHSSVLSLFALLKRPFFSRNTLN